MVYLTTALKVETHFNREKLLDADVASEGKMGYMLQWNPIQADIRRLDFPIVYFCSGLIR